jgi:valyl-tRNA synthetase
MKEFPSQYTPSLHEAKTYKKWEASGLFSPTKASKKQENYADILPPPNANGELHIGHLVGHSVMDLMGRVSRMMGKRTLLVPGKDHGGIQTQYVYEKKLLKERGLRRSDLDRETFYKEIYEFCIDRSQYMRNQEKKMGLAADWSREKFTLDPKISRVVQETFVKMYNDGLIYRGERIINWCPGCMTALSDVEVKYKKEKTKFYYFKYGPVVIGTARPETKFQDKVIVAHPSDKRYKKYFGKTITMPWINGDVQATFLADESVDPKFGTGAMTITPAHSFEDFAIAKKHNLPIVQIIDEKGNLTSAAGKQFEGKNARASREAIVQILKDKGLLVKVDENYEHNLSVCERSDDPIEPLISKQWFVNVDHKKFSLKKEAIKAVKTGKLKIYPKRFESVYIKWMEELYDWNISRQIWWGHRIPVYYCENCGEEKPIVSLDAPKKCPSCESTNIKQDSDTLDTWFSSGQWAYTTLGFQHDKKLAEQSQDFQDFFPSDLMIMGRDLIFFWNARMILMSLYTTKQVPYKCVYFTGLLQDKNGKKMSKSRGNGIDPQEMIEKYGADALRLAVLSNSTAGNDFRMYEEKIASYRNFTNKLWNISRFIEMRKTPSKKKSSKKTLADQWILSCLEDVIAKNTKDLDLNRLEVSLPATRLYDFIWSDFADWYLEAKKIEDPKASNSEVLENVLEACLKMLHPYIPFVTEMLWQEIGHKDLLMAQSWPRANTKNKNTKSEKDFILVQQAVSALRNIRAEYQIPRNEKIPVLLPKNPALQKNAQLVSGLSGAVTLSKGNKSMVSRAVGKLSMKVDIAGLINIEKEVNRAQEELERITKFSQSLEKQLANKGFVDHAPTEVVALTKEKLATQKEKSKELEKRIKELNHL